MYLLPLDKHWKRGIKTREVLISPKIWVRTGGGAWIRGVQFLGGTHMANKVYSYHMKYVVNLPVVKRPVYTQGERKPAGSKQVKFSLK